MALRAFLWPIFLISIFFNPTTELDHKSLLIMQIKFPFNKLFHLYIRVIIAIFPMNAGIPNLSRQKEKEKTGDWKRKV